jgi:XTP/dITP diphosphohydrolase
VIAPPSVILATRNLGKAREFGRLLEGVFDLRTVPAEITLPEETGETFAENARLKAAAVFAAVGGKTGVLADDSGLEVTALEDGPGVQSARYAGENACDEENVQKLLAKLAERDDRDARFVCALSLVLPPMRLEDGETPRVFAAEGLLEGTITRSPRGDDGFGYDPVFEPLGWTETLAEADPAEKDRVSHRGAAARALLARLKKDGVVDDGS